MHTSQTSIGQLHRAEFYIRKRGDQTWRHAALDDVYPRSWFRRALLPEPVTMQTSAQVVRADALNVLKKARRALYKRGLEATFEIVAFFY